MLARRLATILPTMRLAEALETTRIHRVGGLTGGRTAVVTMRPSRAPHHTISDVGLIGGGQRPCRGKCPWRTTAFCCWMNGPSSGAMSSRSCGNRSRIVSSHNHFAPIADVVALAVLAARSQASTPAHTSR
jgi:hypothetical protein